MIVDINLTDDFKKYKVNDGFVYVKSSHVGGVSRNFLQKVTEQKYRNLHGSFAIVYVLENFVRLICDPIGSIPLFYCIRNNNLYIGDDGFPIGENINGLIDSKRLREYQSFMYVTESETLINDVFTVMAGESVTININNATITNNDYVDFRFKFGNLESKQNLINEFDKILVNVYSDLIDRLKGRTAAVLISAGLDSRTNLVMLKRLGYDNLVCFSYGKEDSFEADKARKIASALGVKWMHMKWTSQEICNYVKSDYYRSSLAFQAKGARSCTGLSMLAFELLKKEGIICKDTVLISGSSLDFLAGSHFSDATIVKSYGKDSLFRYIYKMNSLRYDLKSDKDMYDKFMSYCGKIDSMEDWIREYAKWDYRNRQSKYIANEMRVAEYEGFGFEMPFWDIRIIDFWLNIPFELLNYRTLQIEYTVKCVDSYIGLDLGTTEMKQKSSHDSKNRQIKEMVRKIPHSEYLYKLLRRMKVYGNDPNAFDTFMARPMYYMYLLRYGINFGIDAIVTRDFAREIVRKDRK